MIFFEFFKKKKIHDKIFPFQEKIFPFGDFLPKKKI